MTPTLSRSLASCGYDFVPLLPGLAVYAAPATAKRIARSMRVRAEMRKKLEREGVTAVTRQHRRKS